MQKYGVKFLQGEKNDISLRALFEIRKKIFATSQRLQKPRRRFF